MNLLATASPLIICYTPAECIFHLLFLLSPLYTVRASSYFDLFFPNSPCAPRGPQLHHIFHCSFSFPMSHALLVCVHGSCIFTFQPLFQILLRSSWPAIVSHFPFLLLFSDVSCAPRGPQIPPPFLLSLHVSCIFIARSLSGLSHSPRAPHFHSPHPHQYTPHHLSFN